MLCCNDFCFFLSETEMDLNTDRIFRTWNVFSVGLSSSFTVENLVLEGVRILIFCLIKNLDATNKKEKKYLAFHLYIKDRVSFCSFKQPLSYSLGLSHFVVLVVQYS